MPNAEKLCERAYRTSEFCPNLSSGLRRLLVSAAFSGILSFWCFSATAQEIGSSHSLPNLSARLSQVQFLVVDGRIVAVGKEAGVESAETSNSNNSHQEKLSYSTNSNSEASVEYELTTAAEQLTVEIIDGQQLTISRHGLKESQANLQVDFSQPNDGPISLTVIDHGTVHHAEGTTISGGCSLPSLSFASATSRRSLKCCIPIGD